MDANEEAPAVIQVPKSISQEAFNKKTLQVKRKTRHHELVEVDGFVFRRKRKALTPSPAPSSAADEMHVASPAAIKLGLQFDGSSPAAPARPLADDNNDDAATVDQATAPGAAADKEEPLNGSEQGSPGGVAANAEDATGAAELDMVPATQDPPEAPRPQHFRMAPSELIYMVEWVLISELKKLPGMTADSAQKAAAQIKEQFAVQLQQRQTGDGAGSSGQAAAGEQGQQEQAATPSNAQVTLLPYQVQQLKAALQDKRNKLLQEEIAWLQLRQQYSDMDEAAPAAEGFEQEKEQEADAAAVAEGASGSPAESPVGPVTAQGESTLRGVSLKVEMLTALVSKMEHLVSSAEAAARSLQTGYHSEKFKVFPHINSPAALIKSITQSQPPNP